MFKLESKGDALSLTTLVNLDEIVVDLTWTSAVDFDLIAVYQKKDGSIGIVYYADKGSTTAFPFIQAFEDAGIGDEGGDNSEKLIVSSPAFREMKFVWFCCWDYNKVTKGESGRMDGSDIVIKMAAADSQFALDEFQVPLVSVSDGNIACVATLDNSDAALGPQLVNSSKSTTLDGLNPEALMAFINS
jgi:uncharacterized protein involved in tellurium resistance